MASDIRIGCSGWSYPHWRRRFYPEKLPSREHFAFYAQHFNTVELNNSFYRQPPRERFQAWREQAPSGFLFAVKGSRYITHIKRLKESKHLLSQVFDVAAVLEKRLGPVLFQLPPNFKKDAERLATFLELLPKRSRAAFEFRSMSLLRPDSITTML